jgi:hypothetical protein
VKILLTFDYELFFGAESGTVEKCMLEPTNELLQIADGKNVRYTFFADVGYLIASENVAELTEERTKVIKQLLDVLARGHDIQLHIHPHWEKAHYENGRWIMQAESHYRLNNFELETAKEIVRRYKAKLEGYIGREVQVFRAGGWCIQPFEQLAETFKEIGLIYDSSVIAGFRMVTDQYAVDFSTIDSDAEYCFSKDVTAVDPDGFMTEFPITSIRYSPLFFWALYLKGKLNKEEHGMIGDGTFISHGSKKWQQLLSYTTGHLSTDGYYATKLDAGLESAIHLGLDKMIIIGHPKGNTKYSVRLLKEFIYRHAKTHAFISFDNVL